VRDYRGEVLLDEAAREQLHVLVETLEPSPEGFDRQLADELRQATGLRFSIAVNRAGTLAEAPEGFTKTRRWEDKRNRS
jgi:hypothetical protein